MRETDDDIKAMFIQYFREHPEELLNLQKRVEARAMKHQISEVGVAVFGLEGRIIREFEQD